MSTEKEAINEGDGIFMYDISQQGSGKHCYENINGKPVFIFANSVCKTHKVCNIIFKMSYETWSLKITYTFFILKINSLLFHN